MSTEYKRIQQRYGDYDDFDDDKGNLLPHEFASVNADDPNTSDGKALYFNFGIGNVDCKRILMSGEVGTSDIDDGAVTSTKIATGSIGMVHLERNAYEEINSKVTVINNTSVPINLSTLNGYKNKKTMYKTLLFSDVLYTGQPMALPATVWVTNNTQYIVTADGYIFTRDYNQGTDRWSTFSCPLRDLEARVTALEEA